jgi:hypothetical protein
LELAVINMHDLQDCFGLTKSPNIVAILKQSPIKKIVRPYSEGMIDTYKKWKPNILMHEMFNYLPGPVLLHLENNDVIGFDGAATKDSIVAWYEVIQGKQNEEDHFMRDICQYMENNDPIYSTKENWTHMIGEKITNIKVLVYDRGKFKRSFTDSFQNVIIFETAKGDMALSHCLLDFQLTRKSEIPKEIWDKATVIEL